jgi:hypothetical protein
MLQNASNQNKPYIAVFLTEQETTILMTFISNPTNPHFYRQMLEGTGLTLDTVNDWSEHMIEEVLPSVQMMVEPTNKYSGILYNIYTSESERATYEGYEDFKVTTSIFVNNWKCGEPLDNEFPGEIAVYGDAAAIPYMYAIVKKFNTVVIRRKPADKK